MTTYSILPPPRFVALNLNLGEALAGGFVHTYVPGGTTPKSTYQDNAGGTINANPITLDAAGSCLLYGSGQYSLAVTDSLGNAVPAYSGLTQDPLSQGLNQSLTGQFYQSAGAVVDRLADRVLVGQAVLNNGNAAPGSPTDWLDTYQSTAIPLTFAQFASLQDAPGETGVLGGARGVNASTPGTPVIGVSGWAYNNSSVGGTGWAVKGASYKTTSPAGNSFGAEFSVINTTGTTYPVLTSNGGVVALQLSSGDGGNSIAEPGLSASSAAVTIQQATSDNSAPFGAGIVVFSNSIAINAGGVHEVLTLQPVYGIQWYNGLTPTSYIYGGATVATGTASLTFSNTGASFVSAVGGRQICQFTPVASSVNAINIQSAATTGIPGVYSVGSDTNVGLGLFPQGGASTNVVTNSNFQPTTDNAVQIGSGSFRWTSVWAVNGSIQTSDPSLKTDIQPLPAALPMIAAINPITFKWKIGGSVQVEKQVEIDEDLFEEGETTADEPVLQSDGTWRLTSVVTPWRRRIMDEVPVLDAQGNQIIDTPTKTRDGKQVQVPIPRTMQVPRRQKKTVTQYDMVEKPGTRTHWGFNAAQIKAAIPAGMDWGAFVQDADGTMHIRPDQLIPVLWKGEQEMAQEITQMKLAIQQLTDLVAQLKANKT